MFGKQSRRTHHPVTTQPAYRTKPSLMTRLRARTAPRQTHHHHNNTVVAAPPRRSQRRSMFSSRRSAAPVVVQQPVHHQRRKTSLSDKISGAMLKLRGSVEHRPGVKAAGTRRMHGTDGRGTRRFY